uniref:Uncharacterized protein n=1 Tax=Maylandia zebra TaxID=106582 RepID=A0A3P9BVH0_9CICH
SCLQDSWIPTLHSNPLKAGVADLQQLKFLRALKDKYFQLAVKLCHMILIYEPDNPEASEFLPLIQKKLLEDKTNLLVVQPLSLSLPLSLPLCLVMTL